MEIKVLGSGCPKCKTLYSRVEEAISNLKLDAQLSKVEDMDKIIGYGVMMTPALVVNEKVVLSGKLPKVQELEELLKDVEQ